MALMESRHGIRYAVRIFVMFAQIVTSVFKDFYCLMIYAAPCLNKVIVLYCITLYNPGLWIEVSGFKPWLRHCIVFLWQTPYFDSQCLSSPTSINEYQQI